MATEHQQWLTKILGYVFNIHYKLGLENKVADALSHIHQDVFLAAVNSKLAVYSRFESPYHHESAFVQDYA